MAISKFSRLLSYFVQKSISLIFSRASKLSEKGTDCATKINENWISIGIKRNDRYLVSEATTRSNAAPCKRIVGQLRHDRVPSRSPVVQLGHRSDRPDARVSYYFRAFDTTRWSINRGAPMEPRRTFEYFIVNVTAWQRVLFA